MNMYQFQKPSQLRLVVTLQETFGQKDCRKTTVPILTIGEQRSKVIGELLKPKGDTNYKNTHVGFHFG